MPCFFRRNLCQIWAYNESSHPLVPPKTIVSCVNYFWTKQKKTNHTGRQRLRKNRTQNGYDEKSNRQRSFKTVFLKVHSQNNPWIVSSRKCRLFFNIQAYVNQIGTYVQRDVSRNTKRKNKRVRLDHRTENESIPIGIKKNG